MIIDCHGHYTTEPKQFLEWRVNQLKMVEDGNYRPTGDALDITDDDIKTSIEQNQRRLQVERGTDVTIISPRASGMGHHLGTASGAIEELSSVGCPAGLDASISRDLPLSFFHLGERPDIDLVPARLIGDIGQPAAVGGKHRR